MIDLSIVFRVTNCLISKQFPHVPRKAGLRRPAVLGAGAACVAPPGKATDPWICVHVLAGYHTLPVYAVDWLALPDRAVAGDLALHINSLVTREPDARFSNYCFEKMGTGRKRMDSDANDYENLFKIMRFHPKIMYRFPISQHRLGNLASGSRVMCKPGVPQDFSD